MKAEESLKDILARAIKRTNQMPKDTHSESLYSKCRAKFNNKLFEPGIWTTSHNNELKKPQLIQIEKVYDYYVLIRKETYNLEGNKGYIRYCVTYGSLIAGLDKIEFLED